MRGKKKKKKKKKGSPKRSEHKINFSDKAGEIPDGAR